jgi:hypothetical protein
MNGGGTISGTVGVYAAVANINLQNYVNAGFCYIQSGSYNGISVSGTTLSVNTTTAGSGSIVIAAEPGNGNYSTYTFNINMASGATQPQISWVPGYTGSVVKVTNGQGRFISNGTVDFNNCVTVNSLSGGPMEYARIRW